MKLYRTGIFLVLAGLAIAAEPARAVTYTISSAVADDLGLAASSIAIGNNSFESQSGAGNGGENCQKVSSWTCANNGNAGAYAPSSNQYAPGADGLSAGIVPDGSQVAYFSGSDTMSQTLTGNSMVAGTTYNLSAYVGQRDDAGGFKWTTGDMTMELLANGSPITGSEVTLTAPAQGQWSAESISYTATASDAGKTIGVAFIDNGGAGQPNIDDVTLSTGTGQQNALEPNLSTNPNFSSQPYAATSDADKGCDGDAFANFGGLDAAPSAFTTCGDTAIVSWAGGTVGGTATTLTSTADTNGTGFEFHVEDSAGSGTQSCAIPESITITGVGTGSFNLPCNITFGSNGDQLQIPGFDVPITIGTGIAAQTFYLISSGTSVLGSTGTDDDDWAFETNLTGCLNSVNSGLGSCGTTTSTVAAFKADDPPFVPDTPEPPSLAVMGAALAGLTALRRQLNRPRA